MRSIAAIKAERTTRQRPYYSATKLVIGPQVPISNITATGETFSFLNSTIQAICFLSVIALYLQGPSIVMILDQELMQQYSGPYRDHGAFDLLCRIQKIKNKSQYLSYPLACIRTLFRTNANPDLL